MIQLKFTVSGVIITYRMLNIVLSITALISGLGVSILLIPVIIRLSHKYKWYDLPDKRKIHTGLIPRLGGAGIFLSFISAVLITTLVFISLKRTLPYFSIYRSLFIIIPFTLIHLVGLVDDFHNLKAFTKFILQIVAASIVTVGGFYIKTLTIPYIGTFRLGFLSYPITVLWIVGLTNALNLVDGMDGLAGGISAFAALSLGIIMLIKGSISGMILSFALFGGIIGFLFYNFPPAKIFMGDSGSLFLGFSLSVIPLISTGNAVNGKGILLAATTLFLIPILDTAAAIFRRIKEKRPIYSPDRKHLHHRLLDLGLKERKILAIIYSFSVYLSFVSITSTILPKETNVYFIIVIWVGTLLSYWFLGYIEIKNNLTARKSENKQNNKIL